jgi:hypothetical protein
MMEHRCDDDFVGEWLGSLEGLTVRPSGVDADGPILQLNGSDGMAAIEVDTPRSIHGLEMAAAELRSVYPKSRRGMHLSQMLNRLRG